MVTTRKKPKEVVAPLTEEVVQKVTELGIIYLAGNRVGYKMGKPEGQPFEVLNIQTSPYTFTVDIKWDDNRLTRAEFQKDKIAGWDFTVG